MLVLQYQKLSPSSLAGHVDTLRTIMRILRRSKCNVKYSAGYNPHMLVFNSPALAVGIESNCEYVAVDMEQEDNLIDRLNYASPRGIVFVSSWQVDKINLSAIVTKATYLVECVGIGKYIDSITSRDYTISYMQKGQQVSKCVSHQIHSAKCIDDDTLELVVDCGNSNLRVDRIVLTYLCDTGCQYDYNITKTNMMIGDETVNKYLDNLA